MTTSAPDTPLLPFSTASDSELQALFEQHGIALTLDEGRKVVDLLGRDPTVTEAVIWGIQGSEHCSYKSSRRFLKGFLTKGKHIILGPVEDSGIVAINSGPKGKRWGFTVTHESHNSPSQIVPFEGAATGIGGTVRDVVCMGARVIGCLDMLRFGDLKTDESRTIAREVVRGIAGYGNPLGIPNLGGDISFDSSFNTSCLVNAIALGLVREDEIIHSYVPEEAGREGYDIILVGKPTDRSGFGGASFSSTPLDEDKQEQNTGAVQEPNPFLERHLLAACYALFDWLVAEGKLGKVSCKDLGAGGVVCASVEQVEGRAGAVVDLDKVHVALPDLPPEVIACGETQERLCFTCHPSLTDHIIKHFNETWDLPSVAENARASVIGKVTEGSTYQLLHKGQVVCSAETEALTCGLQYERPTEPMTITTQEPDIVCDGDTVTVAGNTLRLQEVAETMLTSLNGCSRAPAFKHYDKDVIGNSILEAGEADAGVIAPLQDLQSYVHDGVHPGWEDLLEADQWCGVAVAGDGNNRYGRISPYWQGVNATIEAMRNVAAVGATPRALTDCLNYGNPEIPEQLWQLAEGVRGVAEASQGVVLEGEGIPVISGNVSLYKCLPDGTAIDPTAIVSCTGMMPDARKATSMQLKQAGSTLVFLGERKDECGGSLYYQVLEELCSTKRDELLGANVPQPEFATVAREIECVTGIINEGLALASHDISDGGLFMSLFEMTLPQRKLGGDISLTVDLAALESDLPVDKLLFSETGGYVLEVDEENVEAVLKLAEEHQVPACRLGKTTSDQKLVAHNGQQSVVDMSIQPVTAHWHSALEKCWSGS